MRYLVFPPGYDPLIDRKRVSREGQQRQELLESLAKIVNEEPEPGRWYQPIEEGVS